MILVQTALATTIDRAKIWPDATAEAQVGDVIRKPFCPIARVVGKELLTDGRTCLIITFPNCHDRHVEEWVLPATEVAQTDAPAPATPKSATPSTFAPATLSAKKAAPTPTPAPTAIGTDNEPPNRGDNRRGRVQPIAQPDKKIAAIAIFGDRQTQYQQFLIIREELAAIGIKVGKLIKSRSDVKGWRLDWEGDKAGLFWTVGNGWEVSSLKYEAELTGNWEGFDLSEHLDCNGIEFPE